MSAEEAAAMKRAELALLDLCGKFGVRVKLILRFPDGFHYEVRSSTPAEIKRSQARHAATLATYKKQEDP